MNNLKSLILSVFVLLVSSPVFSAGDFDYPELMVSPSASERVLLEAKNESSQKYKTHLPLQVSALTTFMAGIIQLSNVDKAKDEDEMSPYVGIVTGGAWLGLTYALSRSYTPYKNAYNDSQKLNDKTVRQKLIKERLAEEAINDAASLGNKLMWMSMLTNAFANGYMLSSAESKTFSVPMNAIGILTSFSPFIFKYTWQKVAKDQKEYKKKIYAPISLSSVLYEPSSKKLAPGLLVYFTF